jgi:hypothetical protein
MSDFRTGTDGDDILTAGAERAIFWAAPATTP